MLSVWSTCALAVVVVAVGSVVCDGVHALLHRSLQARGVWSVPGRLHQAHHRFLDEQLAFHPQRFVRNVLWHQLPEAMMRLVVTSGLAFVLGMSSDVVVLVAAVIGVDLGVVLARRGRDAFHDDIRPVPPPRAGWFVDAAYHAHHHAFPDHFIAAHVQVLDRLLGRLLPLRDRNVVVIGGSRYCQDLVTAVESDGARATRYAYDAVFDDALATCDVLVLGHGAHHRDGCSYEHIITRTLRARDDDKAMPLDVWAVSTGGDDVWRARAPLFSDRAVIRHLHRAPAMGAARTLFFLRRGARSL